MKVLLTIPHVFSPKKGSLYSSQTEAKRESKEEALYKATIGNLNLHRKRNWIHASLGNRMPVVNREMNNKEGLNYIRYTLHRKRCATSLPWSRLNNHRHQGERLHRNSSNSPRLLEQADNYDLVGYIEDDIQILDREFFKNSLP